MSLDSKLVELYADQRRYNQHIRSESEDATPEYWTTQYLLGLMSEMDEMLREINWKRHRKENHASVDRINLGYELADLTKYVLSLWELWSYNSEDLLQFTLQKTRMLDILYQQEHTPIPTDRPIVITDLDGTIADYRLGFLYWMRSKTDAPIPVEKSMSVLMDQDMHISYPDYDKLKGDFESNGGYRSLPSYPDGIEALRYLHHQYNAFIIAVTARPHQQYNRIWLDSWLWLQENNVPVDQLHIGSEPRILLAHQLSRTGPVVLFEDDPVLIRRSARSGIQVYARRHAYNENLEGEINVHLTDDYTTLDLDRIFQKDQEPDARKE